MMFECAGCSGTFSCVCKPKVPKAVEVEVNTQNLARLEFIAEVLKAVKKKGRNEPLGDEWRDVVIALAALEIVLESKDV